MATLWNQHSVTVVFGSAGTTDATFLSYLPDLSRVRVDEAIAAAIPDSAPLNSNTSFETDTTGWLTASFGSSTLTRSTAQAHEGAASGLITPDGVASFPAVYGGPTIAGAVEEGVTYNASAWVYAPNGYDPVRIRIDWYDATDTVFASTTPVSTTVPAATWTQLTDSGAAPVGAVKAAVRIIMGSTPTVSDLLYLDEVELVVPGQTVPAGATRVIERSVDLITWVTVRGGTPKLVDGDALPLNDFEFAGNTQNYYRIRVFVEGELFWTFRDSITVVLEAIWLSPVRRPFLSRTVTVTNYDDIERPARSGVFDVVGRSLPIAVVDVHGSQRYTLEVTTTGLPAARDMDLIVSSGDVFYVHGPADCPIPDGYYIVGDLSRSRKSTYGQHRYFQLPLTQVASPSALLEGVTFTWRGLANRYATWADVMNAKASWRAVLDLIGTVGDVVVP